MAERLDYVRLVPRRILDAGCGTGGDAGLLRARFAQAELIGCDYSLAMLGRVHARRSLAERLGAALGRARHTLVCADIAALPLSRASVSMIWSNLALAWAGDAKGLFDEWHRVLEPEGLVMFSTYGPDTLKELRAARPQAVHTFIDMHDLGDALVRAGFADPVMDMEVITLEYAAIDALMHDLRASGQRNTLADRSRGLLGRRAWAAMRAQYDALRTSGGKLPATFEIVYGHAWRGNARKLPDGRAVIEVKHAGRRA